MATKTRIRQEQVSGSASYGDGEALGATMAVPSTLDVDMDRLRTLIKDIKGSANWYTAAPVDVDLGQLTTHINASGATGVNGIVLKSGIISDTDSTDDIGASGTAFRKLYVDDVDLNGQGSISIGGTGRIDLDADDDTSIRASADDVITFEAGGSDIAAISATALYPSTDDGAALGSANNNWSDLFLADSAVLSFGDSQDVTFTHNGTTTVTVAGGTLATAALTTSTIVASGIVKTDDTTEATSTTDGSLQTDGGLSVAKSAVIGDDLDLLSDGAIFAMGVGQDVKITHDGGTGATLASAGAFLIDGANSVSIDGASGINIGTNDSAVAVSIGHSTSEVTVNDNLTVTGDLTVNGATVTIDATNLSVKDPIITLGEGAQALNSNAGLLFTSGSSIAAKPGVAFGRVANDTWGLGVIAVPSSGTMATVAGMTTSGMALRAGKFELDSASDYIELDTNVKIIAAADVLIDPAGGELVVDGNLVSNTDSTDDLGASGVAWNKLWVDEIDLNGQGDISMGGTGRIDLDANDNTSIRASADDVITFEAGGTDILDIIAGGIQPVTDDGVSLGSANKNFSDLFLADAAVLNLGDDQDVTVTHDGSTGATIASAGKLDLSAGAASAISMVDNTASALAFKQAGNTYLEFVTTNSSEAIKFSKAMDYDAAVMDLTTQATQVLIKNNQAGAVSFNDGSSDFLVIDTTGVGNVHVKKDNALLTVGAASDMFMVHNGTNSLLKSATGHLVLSASNADKKLLLGDAFSGAAGISGGTVQLAASTAEYSTYIANYGAASSLISAINSAGGAGTRAKKSYSVTGSHAAAKELKLATAGVSHDQGSVPANLDVFVNGQLLTSGTSDANGDYKAHGIAANELHFFFQLEAGDQITTVTL